MFGDIEKHNVTFEGKKKSPRRDHIIHMHKRYTRYFENELTHKILYFNSFRSTEYNKISTVSARIIL